MLEIVLKEHGTKNERELEFEILALLLFNQQNFLNLMAKVAELQASVDALSAQVALIPQSGPVVTGISEADLDPIKAGIDQATANIAAKLTPTP